jgi:hypothetical protein
MSGMPPLADGASAAAPSAHAWPGTKATPAIKEINTPKLFLRLKFTKTPFLDDGPLMLEPGSDRYL